MTTKNSTTPNLSILASLLLSFSTSSLAATLGDVVNANRNSVVYIKVQKAAENTGAVTEQHGTGFVVRSDGYVITAAHVVSSGPGFQVEIRGAEASREGALEGMEVLYENSNFDVALLRFKNSSKIRRSVSIGDSWKVADHDTVYAMGFPGTEEWFHTEGKISGKGPKGSWNTTTTLNPGMSGGPIFNTDGEVIAMVWGGVSTQGISGINRIIPINILMRILDLQETSIPPPPSLSTENPRPNSTANALLEAVEFVYNIDQTQSSRGEFSATTERYSRTFTARPSFKIIDYKYVAKSTNNASIENITLSENGKTLTVEYSLTSGPIFDQWRGWLDADIITRQVMEDQ